MQDEAITVFLADNLIVREGVRALLAARGLAESCDWRGGGSASRRSSEGTVMQFVGDAVVAVFGAPLAQACDSGPRPVRS